MNVSAYICIFLASRLLFSAPYPTFSTLGSQISESYDCIATASSTHCGRIAVAQRSWVVVRKAQAAWRLQWNQPTGPHTASAAGFWQSDDENTCVLDCIAYICMYCMYHWHMHGISACIALHVLPVYYCMYCMCGL